MSAIFKKEFKGFFNNMTGYVFIAVLLVFAGVFVGMLNIILGQRFFERALTTMDIVFVVVIPLITMNSFALERKNKTDQLLLTSPVKVWEIVAGKFLAMAAVYLIPVMIIGIYPLVLSAFGDISLPTAYMTLLAFYLMGCALISIGMFISSLTESSVISAVASIGVMLLLYLMDIIVGALPKTAIVSFFGVVLLIIILGVIVYLLTKNTVAAMVVLGVLGIGAIILYITNASVYEGLIQNILGQLAIFTRIDDFVYGKLSLVNIVYFLSVTFLFGFFTVRTVDKRRWN